MSLSKYKKIDLINIATKNNIPIKNRQKKIKTKAELFDSLKKRNKLVGGDTYKYYDHLIFLYNLLKIIKDNEKYKKYHVGTYTTQRDQIHFYFKKYPTNYITQFLLNLEYHHDILTKLFNQKPEEIKNYVFYKKDDNNHEKNHSYKSKQTSNNIKVIKLKNDKKYIHDMIEDLNKIYRITLTGSCFPQSRTIRIRMKSSYLFESFVFCLKNNKYIIKIENNNKHRVKVGDVLSNNLQSIIKVQNNKNNNNISTTKQSNKNSNNECIDNKRLLAKLTKPIIIRKFYMNVDQLLNSFFLGESLTEQINIKKEYLESNDTNTCNDNLFKLIMNYEINQFNHRTKYIVLNENGVMQTGLDYGGITRRVFDIFYKSYINKYFDLEDEFHYLKKKTKEEDFIQATNRLILIGLRSKVSIIIKLNEDIIKLFNEINKFKDVNDYINSLDLNDQNLINKFSKTKMPKTNYDNGNKILNILNKKSISNILYEPINTITINNYMSKTNNSNQFNLKHSCYNNFDDTIKKHIIFRIYLYKLKFFEYDNFLIMYNWYRIYWNDSYEKITYNLLSNKFKIIALVPKLDAFGYKFTSQIDYSKEIFLSKIDIEDRKDKKLYSIKDYLQLRKKFRIKTPDIIKSKNLGLIIDYISEDNDNNRRKFNKYVTGSEYNDSKIELKFYSYDNEIGPINAHTCFNSLEVYKSPEFNTINDLDLLITSENSNVVFSH